jgi:hypothetical protein
MENKINFYWNGSIVGTNHSMSLNNKKISLGGITSTEQEAKLEAIEILKQSYNIDYKIEDIKFVWGGRL